VSTGAKPELLIRTDSLPATALEMRDLFGVAGWSAIDGPQHDRAPVG
jgi:hypothetical protein